MDRLVPIVGCLGIIGCAFVVIVVLEKYSETKVVRYVRYLGLPAFLGLLSFAWLVSGTIPQKMRAAAPIEGPVARVIALALTLACLYVAYTGWKEVRKTPEKQQSRKNAEPAGGRNDG